MTLLSRLRGAACWGACVLLLGHTAPAAATIVTTADANALAQALLAPGSGLTLLQTYYSGALTGAGLHDGIAGGIGPGILLTTGSAASAIGPSSNTASQNNARPGLTLLETQAGVPGTSSRDGAYLQLELQAGPQAAAATLDFVFATEETPITSFDDAFAGWIRRSDGSIAPLPLDGGAIAVTVNSATLVSGGNAEWAYDRYTAVRSAGFPLQPGETFTLTLAIADVGGGLGDSGVYLANLHAVPVPEPATVALLALGLGALAVAGRRRRL